MKKVIFTLLIFFFSLSIGKAFSFDLDLVDFNENPFSFDTSYSIAVEDFSKKEDSNKEIKEFAKELLTNSFYENAGQILSNFMYVNSSNGFETINASIYIKTYLEKLSKYSISYEKIKIIRVVSFSDGDLAFLYLDDALVNKERKDVVFAFWIKDNKLFYPWFTIEDDLENYFNEVTLQEEKGNIFGGTFHSIDLGTSFSNTDMNSLYQKNVLSNVQITGLRQDGVASYGSGFVLKEGVIVTSWSLLLEMLTTQSYIYVTDAEENSYKIDGVVSVNVSYDVVVLKLDKEIQNPVTFGDSRSLVFNETLFLINSNTNKQYSIRYGSVISSKNGRLQNLFALDSADIGSALYTKNGQVVGINTNTILRSAQSVAHSTNYLIPLQSTLNSTLFKDIESVPLETIYSIYYLDLEEEKTALKVSLESLEEVGDLLTIPFPLLKSSEKDGIISLRYKNSTSFYSMSFLVPYEESLIKEGYQMIYQSTQRKVYRKDKKKIILKESMNYIIILIMEE